MRIFILKKLGLDDKTARLVANKTDTILNAIDNVADEMIALAEYSLSPFERDLIRGYEDDVDSGTYEERSRSASTPSPQESACPSVYLTPKAEPPPLTSTGIQTTPLSALKVKFRSSID